MEKKQYIQIAICSLIILIACAMFNYYYQTYIAPESFVIGSVKYEDYKALPIKDYLSDDKVIFSQNINDVTFARTDNTALYEYNFEAKEFNGEEKNYIIYVNDYMINNLDENAGTVGGTYNLKYYDVDKEILCSSAINIDFSFYSLRSVLKVTFNYNDVGYLMKYFETDNFVITLAENPYSMMNKDGEVDEKIQEIISLTKTVNELNNEITALNTEISQHLQDIADLTQSNEENTAEVERLQKELSNTQAEVTTLTSKLATASAELQRLEAENIEIIAENTDLKALVETQKTTIATLEQTVSDLQYQVSYYEQLLEEYQNINKLSVSFKVNTEAIDVQLVNSGEFATEPEAPTKEFHTFLGWSVDGSNVVKVSTYPITENTTFIALFEELATCTVTFVNGETTTESRNLKDSALVLPETPIKEDWEFLGWSTDETSNGIINTDNYLVTEDLELTAIFRQSVLIPTEYPLAFTLSTAENDFSYKTFDFSSVCDSSSLLNCGLEFSLELKYTATVDAGTAKFDISITEATTEYWMESVIGGYFPVELTADNKLLLGKRDVGVNYTFIPGTHRFEITEIYIYSK